MSKIALVYNVLREDEKFIIEASKKNNVDLVLLNTDKLILNTKQKNFNFDLVLNRCISNFAGEQITYFFENINIPVINNSKINTLCSNKFLTSLFLYKNNIPTIPFIVFFNENLIDVVNQILEGYPLVLKPIYGSWGRLLSKINDKDSFETVLEHKKYLSAPYHHIFYVTKYIEKPGRDIRVTIVGSEIICAVYRKNSHWISNTARGGIIEKCEINNDILNICKKIINCLGEGIIGVDIFESKDGYLVNEINHTVEFKNIQKTLNIDIGEKIIKYCLEKLK